jgi:hypothetical protein
MKKHLLILLLVVVNAGLSFSQFTITSTSISYTGHAIPASTAKGQFYVYHAYSGTNYSESTCTTPFANGALGGFGSTPFQDATTANPAHSDGILFSGGKIANVYFSESWSACAPHMPSFGFYTGTGESEANGGGISGTSNALNVDLSLAANQKIKFTYQSNVALSLELNLLGPDYQPRLNGTPVSIIGDNAPHTLTLDFSSNIKTGADLTNVRQVSFIYTSSTPSPDFAVSLSDITVGSAVVAGTKEASSMVADSKLYPNPTSGSTNIELNLKSSANVKVVLNDIMGNEVKVIADKYTNTLSESFDVNGLTKGIYSVTYLVDGVPAKTEKLIVK